MTDDVLCVGCDKKFRKEDVAPYQRNADGAYAVACRYCIQGWIKAGFLWPIQFWQRQEGLDRG